MSINNTNTNTNTKEPEGKYPNPFTQNEFKNIPLPVTLGLNLNQQQDNSLSALDTQMKGLTLGYESKYRKESTPLPPHPSFKILTDSNTNTNVSPNLNTNPNTKTEPISRPYPLMHKMSEGSLSDLTKSKANTNVNTFVNPLSLQGKLREGIKVNVSSDKYLPSANYLNNSQASPICSYYDSSQRYFSQSLQKDTQNEELDTIPESHNFIRKSSVEDDMEPKAYQFQEIGIGNPFQVNANANANDDGSNAYGEGSNAYGEYMTPTPQAQGFNQNYLDMKYNFFNQNNQQSQESPQLNPSLIPNYGLSNQNLFRANQHLGKMGNKGNSNTNTNAGNKGNSNNTNVNNPLLEFGGGYEVMLNNNQMNNQDELNEQGDNDNEQGDNDNDNDNDQLEHDNNDINDNENEIDEQLFHDDNNNNNNNSNQSIHSDDYIFEKYGKKGWMCEKCNNFNFENRKNCNRCSIPKQPKLLSKIKEKNQNIFPNPFKISQPPKMPIGPTMGIEDRKRKPFTERKGDWRCSKCHNLNFAFRLICNMCQLPLSGQNIMKTNKPTSNFSQHQGQQSLSQHQPQIQMPMQMPMSMQVPMQMQVPMSMKLPMQIPNQYQMPPMQYQPQMPYPQFQHTNPRMQQNQINPFYQNMLNNQINIYNNYYNMMQQQQQQQQQQHQQSMLNKKQSQFNQHQHLQQQ